MAKESELVRLEKHIERLLAGYSDLQAEKLQLEAKLRDLRSENDRIRKELQTMDSEREEVCGRVTSLISRIERWESETEGRPSDDVPLEEVVSPPDPSVGAEGPDTVDLPEGEESGGSIQGNLFSS